MSGKETSARGVGLIMASALVFGFTPILAAISYQGGNNGVNMAFLRALLPLPLIFFLSRGTAKPTRAQTRMGVLLGLLSFGCTLLLYSSYAYISVGTATTLHFLYPLYVVLYERIFRRRRMGVYRVLGLLCGLAGVLLFLDIGGASLDARGVVPALLSGMCYAAYIVALGREGRAPLPLYRLMRLISLTGVLLCGAAGLLLGKLTVSLTPAAWGYAFAAAMLVSVGGSVLFQAGVRHVGETLAAVFSLLEP